MTVREIYEYLGIDDYAELGSSGSYYANISEKKFNNLINKLDNDSSVVAYDDEQLLGENQIRLVYSYEDYDIELDGIFLTNTSKYTVRVESKLF